jgi:hypothetical protein
MTDIFAPKYSVTGIRSENANNTQVIITGSCPLSNNLTNGMIYSGPMNPIDSSGINCMLPNIVGATTAIFYGPDTPFFNPLIGEGNVRVVGSYRCGEDYDHGVLYEGPPDGSGNSWTTIDMPDHVAGGEVRSTIPHSTMGELIVGNYDLLGFEGKFNAFIYDMRTTKYHRLNLKLQTGIVPRLVTAYGVWQNHKDSYTKDSYTIAGGLFDGSGLNVGYLVDYDSLKHGQTIVPTTFSFDNMPGLITHFEGIAKYGEEMTKFGPRFYSLAATGDQSTTTQGGAAFAVVERLPDGSFGEAFWKQVQVTSSGITTGNTVLTNNLFGIYTTIGSHSFQSYVMGNLP